MKKEMFVLAVLATLAACSKTEVTPVASNVNSEITFNVAPRTKALSQTQTDFDHNNVFVSYAYYLGPGKTWAANNSEAQMYIDGSTISYNGNLWKNETTSYYWPKDGGSLTFFAYSYNKKDMTVGDNSGFACVWALGEDGQYQGGITGHFDVATNKNVDFLVADIAADKTENENNYAHTGVPTLFRHKLSMVNVAANLAEDYANKKFILNSVKFTNLCHYATYSQIPEKMIPGGNMFLSDQVYAENVGFEVKSGGLIAVPAEIKKGAGVEDGQYIYIPQEFNDDSYIVITYTVETVVGNKVVKEECTKTVKVKDVFPKWEMGHRYTFNLTVSLNEIHWDPAVENWTDDKAGNITIDR